MCENFADRGLSQGYTKTNWAKVGLEIEIQRKSFPKAEKFSEQKGEWKVDSKDGYVFAQFS